MHSVPVVLHTEVRDSSSLGAIRLHESIWAGAALPPSTAARVSVLGMHGSGTINGRFVSSAADVSAALAEVEPATFPDVGEQMSGSLTVYLWDAAAERLTILTDPLGASLVFLHRGQKDVAISSHIGNLAALRALQGRPLRKSLAFGLSAMVTGGPGLFPASYEDVELLDHFHYVEVDRDGAHIRAYPAHKTFGQSPSYEAALDSVEDEVRRNIRIVAGASHARRIAQLTGGLDSRAVLGGLLREGEQDGFAFNCMGDARTPDKTTAHGLAT